MESEACLLFHPFRLDPVNERLWRGEQRIALRPKPFALLRYLVEHADTLVTKADLRAAVWGNTHVAEGVLRGYIRDLRKVLGDDPAAPRFIETVDRRGYRFIAPVTTALAVASRQSPVGGQHRMIPYCQLTSDGWPLLSSVGRPSWRNCTAG